MAMSETMRLVYLAYFVTHIPITMLLDGQAVLGDVLAYPQALVDLGNFHCSTNDDFLMRDRPDWFKGLITVELLLQLPFFFVAVYGLWIKANWIRTPLVIYGAHVATTMVPIYAAFLQAPVGDGFFRSEQARWALCAIYFPYLLIPLMLVISLCRNAVPFPAYAKSAKIA